MSLAERRPRNVGPEEVIRGSTRREKENEMGRRKQIRRNHEMIPTTD